MLKPLGDRVIIEMQKPQEKTVGGIVLADNAKQKPQTGLVSAVGPKVENVKKDVKVLFDKYAGTSVKYEGKSYLVVHEKDIAAIVD